METRTRVAAGCPVAWLRVARYGWRSVRTWLSAVVLIGRRDKRVRQQLSVWAPLRPISTRALREA